MQYKLPKQKKCDGASGQSYIQAHTRNPLIWRITNIGIHIKHQTVAAAKCDEEKSSNRFEMPKKMKHNNSH